MLGKLAQSDEGLLEAPFTDRRPRLGGVRPRQTGDTVRITPATRVAEVAYDRADNGRLRHPARLVGRRPDRDARSCTFERFGES
ncbi:MAG: hypothetical protein QOC55_1431 [Thermoleophilaceae bacterium]|jgi:ATP-dependent DNA ligase|nr:hypothetical protein [Thermoleophilaceae bacterium]